MEPIEIDGSQHEGGGQILRLSSSLSTILSLPIRVNKIRGGRSKPGLRPQHLTGLQLVRDICRGYLEGAKINSSEIVFFPKEISGGSFMADTQTAGSVCLLMQSLLPCSLFGKNSSFFTLRGGTNADMAPPIDYTTEVFKKLCTKLGIHFEVKLNVRGFFPKGRGEVVMKVDPLRESIPAFSIMEQGKVVSISGFSFVAGVLPIRMAHVMADEAEKVLSHHFGSSVRMNIPRFKETPQKAFGNGCFIIVWAETTTGCILGSSGLGKREISPEEVGRRTAEDLIKEVNSGSCVDIFAQDQLVIFMALAKGTSRIRTSPLSLHTKTAIHIAETLTKATFTCIEDSSTNTIILECEGIGALPPV